MTVDALTKQEETTLEATTDSAPQPATSGVAMLVPESKKNATSDETPKKSGGGAAALECVDRIEVPGATTSGLNRPSLVGPRLLNAAIPSGSSDTE